MPKMHNFLGVVATAAALLVFSLIVYWLTGCGGITQLAGAVVVVFLGAAGAIVLAKMLWDQIDLRYLVSEDNGNASLSRFQFLIFTFVIAASYFLVVIWGLTTGGGNVLQVGADNVLTLPSIPAGVLGLIGISGGSYVISKGIQKSADANSGSSITGITITSGGSGYSAQTTVAFAGGGGSGAQGKVNLNTTNGAITGVDLLAGGNGYTAAPTISFADPATTGKDAAATATIG